jgi:FAD-linked sulfhydryl oxidase
MYCSGECAEHFGIILNKFPPQVSTRSTAAAWGCHVHNEVNKSLKKELFDCSNIGDFYDCGCAETEEEKAKRLEASEKKKVRDGPANSESKLKVERDGWTKGG